MGWKLVAPERGEDMANINEYVQGKRAILKTFKVKGYKSWHAREGVGAEATLYKDGKKIGWVIDEGVGGEVELRATGEDFRMVVNFLTTLPRYEFNDYWKEQYDEEWDGENKSELEFWKVFNFANVMLEEAEEQIQLRKSCKTKILVRYEGEKDFRQFQTKWPKDTLGQIMIMSQLIKQVQPNVIAEFINKRFD